MQVGYGTEQALRRLHEKEIPVHVQKGIRIGIVIADDFAAVFAPPALNVDVFPSAGVPNAVCLSTKEAERLLRAVAADDQGNATPEGWEDLAIEGDGQEDFVPRIGILGEAFLHESDLTQIHETLVRHPPVSPDLDRQMRIINSMFQVVKITLNGAKLSQRRLPLRAEELGIEDAELRRRIGASFKLFETDVDSFTRAFQDDLDEIKRKYNLKPVGEMATWFSREIVLGWKMRCAGLRRTWKSRRSNSRERFKKNLITARIALKNYSRRRCGATEKTKNGSTDASTRFCTE